MPSIGGSIVEVSIDSRIFSVASDADANRKLGGLEAELQANGNGTARKILTAVPWMFGPLVLDVDDDRNDQEFLQQRSNESGFVACTITLISGNTYQGDGTVSGELQYSSANGTAEVTLSGPGELTKQ